MSTDLLDPPRSAIPVVARVSTAARSGAVLLSLLRRVRKARRAGRRPRAVGDRRPGGWLGSTTPPLSDVAVRGWEMLASGALFENLGVSLVRVLKGLAIGLPTGLALGLLSGLFRISEDIIDAPVQAVRMLPHLALVPLFIIWFGIGETSKVGLIAVGTVFPLYINVFHGIRGVDERLVESARTCGLGRFGLIRKVILPGALPQILVGLRLSLGVAWLTLVVVEQSATASGIGFVINQATQFLQMETVFLVLVVYALLGVSTDLLVRLIERRALAWRRGLVAR
ncbi:ABC transporter permease [Actinomadura madurae]|uniref:ABC transporter permease n=1 Tax=Actinomadura madurae TaxID=1993 RepID=UPI0020D23FBF|nr:ABC transporter permease [Actinomadura madurae]MCP9948145.1 ABC transporter permease [Actinomadura madurae]